MNDSDYRDWFMMFIITGRTLGKMLFSSVVGMGSNLHDLDFVVIISLLPALHQAY